MTREWLLAIAITVTVVFFIARLPDWLKRREESLKHVATLADDFYKSANELLKDRRTPPEVIFLISIISQNFSKPKIIREIVLSAIRGNLTDHAREPSEQARVFLRAFKGMPEQLQSHFTNAVICGLLASSERATFFGLIFTRMMLFNPTAQKKSVAPTYASKIASLHGDFLVNA
ncbi:MAG: hypothetical protein ACR2PI_08935 [Hyphomicrobiaceae bacterium]